MPAKWLADLGMSAANQVIGGGLGLLLQGHNDRRQRRQQEWLQELQMKGNKEMADYNYNKQMEMWHNTNYAATREEMEKAGLNVGLMYGQGGGGGATTGSGGGAGVSGAMAPAGGGEVQAGMQMALQTDLLRAQKEVLASQADKNRADADATRGVNTDEGRQRIEESKQRVENLFQGLQNLRQTHEMQKLELTAKNITNYELQKTQTDRLGYIEQQTKIAKEQLHALKNNNKVSDATIDDNIKRIEAEAIGAVLDNILTKTVTGKTIADTDVSRQRVREISQTIMRDWDKMSQTEREIMIKESLKDWTTDPNREAMNNGIHTLNSIIKSIR